MRLEGVVALDREPAAQAGGAREARAGAGPSHRVQPMDTESLFQQHAAFVAAFAHRLGARGAEVDDLVQEVFLLAHRRGGYRSGAASPTTFLARLTLEVMHGTRRRARRFVASHEEAAQRATTGAPPRPPDDELHMRRMAEQLELALAAIEPGRRAIFVLFELEGESCTAIAAAFELKIGTVYSRLHAARKEFQEAVDRIVRGPDHGHGPGGAR